MRPAASAAICEAAQGLSRYSMGDARSPLPRSLEQCANQQKETERNDRNTDRCGDDTDGYGYAGSHQCEADECGDDTTCEFEYERDNSPDGVERPARPHALLRS